MSGEWGPVRLVKRVVSGTAVVLLLLAAPASGQPPVEGAGQRIEQYLAAGEFAPALLAARRLEDPARRDRQLARIAAAQARAGARQAAVETLATIQNDRRLTEAINALGPDGGRGGGVIADFDTLINLIMSTVAPDTWTDLGGTGAIEPFPTGVYVDTDGVLRLVQPAEATPLLDDLRRAARRDSGNRDVRRPSALRKVSLNRLEKQMQLRCAFGDAPDDAMQSLAGLYRVQYVLLYPETGDLVLAGPAGDWCRDAERRLVNVDTRQPVLQLDDLIVMLRNAYAQGGRFGCAIKPQQENLARVQEFAGAWRDRSVAPRDREEWLAELRSALGRQEVAVWGVDPRSRAARVLVEADYRMKLVGMGLEDGTLGVDSYLEAAARAGEEATSSMSVLRWWFTLNYKGIRATPNRDVFVLDGQGVRVLSENELLSETGQRVPLGKSDELNRGFARSFTRHFDRLAAKYPVYAELRNLFDLAIIAALFREQDLPGQVDWHVSYWRDPAACPVALGTAIEQVESVVNAVSVNRRRFVAGVSGGVAAEAGQFVRTTSVAIDDYGRLEAQHDANPRPAQLPADVWWWD